MKKNIFYKRQLRLIVAVLLLISLCIVTRVYAVQEAKELFFVAQEAFEDGFYDVAIRYINQLLEKYPDTERNVKAKLLLGQCYFFKKEYLKAYDTFHDLLQYTELKDATLFWLGETYLKGADYKEAEKHYKELIELYPDSIYTPQAYYSLGWLYFDQKEFKKAGKMFKKLVHKFPKHQLCEEARFKLGEIKFDRGKYKEALRYFEEYLKAYPQSTRRADAYFIMGESCYSINDFLTAITYYTKAADIAYDSNLILMAKVSLGWCYLKLGKYNISQKYFDAAEKFAKQKGIDSDDIYLGKASLFTETGEYKKALDAYSQLIERFPKSKRIFEAYLGKANTYYKLKQYLFAIRTYKELINKLSVLDRGASTVAGSRSTRMYYGQGATASEIVNNHNSPLLNTSSLSYTKHQPLSKDYKDILEKAYFGLAWSYLKSGDVDSSIKIFRTVKDKTDNEIVEISALAQIGDAYQDIGQYNKAIEVYDEILKEYSNSPYLDYVQYRQGIALLKSDKVKAAVLSFETLKANFPESKFLKDVKYYLAVSYFKMGDWSNTIEQMNDFIASSSEKDKRSIGEAYYILALAEFNIAEYKKALKSFNYIIKQYKSEDRLIGKSEIGIAKCYYRIGKVDESIKRFKILVYKYPNSSIEADALIWLGDYYLGVSDFDNAIDYYSQFVKEFPEHKQINMVLYDLGQAYFAKEEYDKALNAFKRIDRKDIELYAKARLVIAEIFSRKLEPDAAIDTYNSIIKTSPEFKRDAYVKIAEIYKGLGEYNKAIAAYKSALSAKLGRSRTEAVEIRFLIGDAYELMGNPLKAVDEYFKIPYLYKNKKHWVVKAYLNIAKVFENEGKWSEAKKIYEKIIGLHTDEAKFAKERIEWMRAHNLIGWEG